MEMSGRLHVPVALTPGKEPPSVIHKRLAEPQRQSGRFGEEENVVFVSGIEPHESSVIQPET